MGAGHDHGHSHGGPPPTGTAASAYKGRLRIALAITLSVMVLEIVGGILSGSLALIADVGARDVAVHGPPPGSPATSTCTPPPAPPPPDNSFSLGKLKRNLKKGTAKLIVKVPRPGELRLRKTKRVRKDTEQFTDVAKVRIQVRPRPKAKSKLAETGKVKVNARVRYTPTGGEPNTGSRKVTLKLGRR